MQRTEHFTVVIGSGIAPGSPSAASTAGMRESTVAALAAERTF